MFPFSNSFKSSMTGRFAACASGLLLIMAMGWDNVSLAIEAQTPALSAQVVATKPVKPSWNELSADKQTILAPLSGSWESLDSVNKKKWLAIAKHYPRMPANEQQRAQERMLEWAQLSPEQRQVARDSYTRIQTLTPEKRAALMQTYQALPDAQKKQLADENRKKTRLVTHKPVTKSAPIQPKPASPAKASTPSQP